MATLSLSTPGGIVHSCNGCNTLTVRERVWHGLYVRWYDATVAGHRIRAHVLGVIADAIVL